MQEAAGKQKKTKKPQKNGKTQDKVLHPYADEEGSPVYLHILNKLKKTKQKINTGL